MKSAHKSGALVSSEALEYISKKGIRLGDVHKALIEETKALGGISMMQISPEQGEFITILTKLTNSRKIIEVGTFTGYSALCFALGLPEDGKLICCDVE